MFRRGQRNLKQKRTERKVGRQSAPTSTSWSNTHEQEPLKVQSGVMNQSWLAGLTFHWQYQLFFILKTKEHHVGFPTNNAQTHTKINLNNYFSLSRSVWRHLYMQRPCNLHVFSNFLLILLRLGHFWALTFGQWGWSLQPRTAWGRDFIKK